MSRYRATIDTGPGQYAINLDVDHCSGGAIQCTVSLNSYRGKDAATALGAKELDALIASLQAARRYVEQ